MLIFGAVTKSYITRMFKSNSGEPYAGKLHVRFLEEFISNCLKSKEGGKFTYAINTARSLNIECIGLVNPNNQKVFEKNHVKTIVDFTELC